MTANRRVILYSHDAMGIGHIRRNLRIAAALRNASDQTTILLISGAAEGTYFPVPAGVDFLALPSLRKHDNGHYEPRRLGVNSEQLIDMRARTIAAAVDSFRPDALIVDKLPRGVAGELVPALSALRNTNARCVLGLRDILDDAAVVRAEWTAGHYDEWITRHYDAIWVYGDRALYDTAAEYDFSPQISAMTKYAGYLDKVESPDSSTPCPLPADKQIVLCMCGGGEDAGALALAFARAPLSPDQHGVILTGPFMPVDDRAAVRVMAEHRSDMDVIDFTPNPIALLHKASRVVLMGGYNSVCEVLTTEIPALVVPRVRPRSEQLVRAEALAARNMIDVLVPDAATPAAIGAWLAKPAAKVSARKSLDFGGLERLPMLLDELLAPAKVEVTIAHRRRDRHVVG